MSAPFSRLQLAAALLEYDNDPTNPDAPFRSAHESAIFAPLRRNVANRPPPPRKSEYLNGATDVGSIAPRESMVDNRRSRASRGSLDALRNPFGPDDVVDSEDEPEEELEVDLASWGLDAFMPKDKGSKNGKGKAKAQGLPNPHPVSSVPSHKPFTNNDAGAPRRALGSRSMSVGNIDLLSMQDETPSAQLDVNRRRSFATPLDLVGVEPTPELTQRSRTLSNPITPAVAEESGAIPFPSRSVRAPSPQWGNDQRQRGISTGSRDSKVLLQVDGNGPPSPSNMPVTQQDDNPFALGPPSRVSRFDPKTAANARTMSNASMGSRMMLENDGASVMSGPGQAPRARRYSTTMDLLRPKVLVMPSPLQSATAPPAAPPPATRDGFQLSTDGPPLPPGARSGRRTSLVLDNALAPQIASNSFTPNATNNLTLSQLTFRNTLMVGSQMTGEGPEIMLPRATQDGEQAQFEPLPVVEVTPQLPVEEPERSKRPPGKLYGKSLIDDLENRKAQMRSKQRVFTGDQRPSMMARGLQRSSTLIDPAALAVRPPSQHLNSFGPPSPGLARKNSASIKPLLNFDDDKSPPTGLAPSPRPPNSRSVFGVDTLWEREMAKLKEIEAQEKLEAEAQRKQEEEEERAQEKRKKKKGKGKKRATDVSPEPAADPVAEPRVSLAPPTLPQIQPTPRRQPPPVTDDDPESEDSDDEQIPPKPAEPGNWHAGSSDEEVGPRRTTGTGPRYPKQAPRRPADDSDEDVPLAVTANHSLHARAKADSDDEKPLSILLDKTKLSLPPMNFDGLSIKGSGGDDDDDQPLGLRASRIPVSRNGEDDDDRPLALHPEQQRRTQYQMLAQVQAAQQQQLMMQAQLQSSMFFNSPPMMGPGFYGPPMMAPQMMMQPPMPIPSPPPMHDEAKYGRVDRWRRDVAVDTEP